MVILKCFEINATNPCFNFSRYRIHCHKRSLHNLFMIFNRVIRTHDGILFSFCIPGKYFHRYLLFECPFDLLITESIIFHIVPAIAVSHCLFDLAFIFFPYFSTFNIGGCIQIFLHRGHPFCNCFFRIFLHTRIDRCINFQTIIIDIVCITVWFFYLFQNCFQILPQHFPEIRSITSVFIHFKIIHFNRFGFTFCRFSKRELSVIYHTIDDQVSPVN